MSFKRFAAALVALLMLVPMCASFSAFAADDIISVGKSYTLEYYTDISNTYPEKAYNPESRLTDGKYAKGGLDDAAWLELYRGTAVSVTIDLEEVMAVSGATIGEYQYKSAGIVCSRWMEIYVSENGTDFGLVGRTDNPNLITDTNKKRVELSVSLDKTYKARYVRVVFSSDIFTYVDEVAVFGSSDAASAVSAEPTIVEEKDLSGDLDGIDSICLMYASGYYDAEMMKYYFAYCDNQGNVKDAMFDALLFLGMPENVYGDDKPRKEDFVAFADKIFSPDLQIDALNKVVGQYKEAAGYDADYQYPIFISVPYPKNHGLPWGEIDGVSITPNSLNGRSSIVSWYVDYIIERFNNAGFENLRLEGFYWFEESINHSVSQYEDDLVKNFNDYVHELGYKTMWIPYFSSAGIDISKDLGFDSVTMQSGYAFGGGAEVGVPNSESVFDAADAAKKYGLNGLEFEIDIYKDKAAERFADYVSAAYNAGVPENGMITMYQAGSHLYDCAVTTNYRTIYDLTYKFLSDEYKEYAPVIKEGATLTMQVESFGKGKLEITDEDNKKSDLRIYELEKPEGIYFYAEGNGYFEAQTYGCKPGTYVARLSVTDGRQVSNTVEVTVIVEGDGSELLESDASVDSGNDEGSSLWIILAAGGAVLLAAIVAVVIIVLKKKKAKSQN